MLAFDDLQQSNAYRLTLRVREERFEIVGYFGKFEVFGRGLQMALEFSVSERDGRVLEKHEPWWIPASNVQSIEAIGSHERNRNSY